MVWQGFVGVLARVHKLGRVLVAVPIVLRTSTPFPAGLPFFFSSPCGLRIAATVIPVSLAAALGYLEGHSCRRYSVQVRTLFVVWRDGRKKKICFRVHLNTETWIQCDDNGQTEICYILQGMTQASFKWFQSPPVLVFHVIG